VAKRLFWEYGMEVIGILDGFSGLKYNDYLPLEVENAIKGFSTSEHHSGYVPGKASSRRRTMILLKTKPLLIKTKL
jgi:6-phosphofructokinase